MLSAPATSESPERLRPAVMVPSTRIDLDDGRGAPAPGGAHRLGPVRAGEAEPAPGGALEEALQLVGPEHGVDEPELLRLGRAEEPLVHEDAHALRREPPRQRHVGDDPAEDVVEDRVGGLARGGRRSVADEGLGGALVRARRHDLEGDAGPGEGVPQVEVRGREAGHLEGGARRDGDRPRRGGEPVLARAAAGQVRDDRLAGADAQERGAELLDAAAAEGEVVDPDRDGRDLVVLRELAQALEELAVGIALAEVEERDPVGIELPGDVHGGREPPRHRGGVALRRAAQADEPAGARGRPGDARR